MTTLLSPAQSRAFPAFPRLFRPEDARSLTRGVHLCSLDETLLASAQALVERIYPGSTAAVDLERSIHGLSYFDAALNDTVITSEHWVAVEEATREVICIGGLCRMAKDWETAIWGSWFCFAPEWKRRTLIFFLCTATLQKAFASGAQRLRVYTEDDMSGMLAASYFDIAGFSVVRTEQTPHGPRVHREFDLSIRKTELYSAEDERLLDDGIQLKKLNAEILPSTQELVRNLFPHDNASTELACSVKGLPCREEATGEIVTASEYLVAVDLKSGRVVGIGGVAMLADLPDYVWGSWYGVDPAYRRSWLAFTLGLLVFIKCIESGRRAIRIFCDDEPESRNARLFYEAGGCRCVRTDLSPTTGARRLWYEMETRS